MRVGVKIGSTYLTTVKRLTLSLARPAPNHSPNHL